MNDTEEDSERLVIVPDAGREKVYDSWWQGILYWLDCQLRALGIWLGLDGRWGR